MNFWAGGLDFTREFGRFNLVCFLQDNENKFDMLVRNCVAHNGKKNPVQLVDEIGCITRPKIMSRFQKIKNFGPSATVVSYAYFQAFKFPDSMNVHFQCVIQGLNSIENGQAFFYSSPVPSKDDTYWLSLIPRQLNLHHLRFKWIRFKSHCR